jgi:nicotinamidase-related amidase
MTIAGLVLLILGLLSAPVAVSADAPNNATTRLPLRTRIQPFHGDGPWVGAHFNEALVNSKTAIIVTDMWSEHWCPSETDRVKQLAQRMEPLLDKARSGGMLIIHAPSGTMDFYAHAPGRLLAKDAPHTRPPTELSLPDVPLPIDDSNGGCDTPAKQYDAWSREISTLSIRRGDVISDDGKEIYNVLKQHKIETVLYVGVASNMCVLDRSFGIKQLSRWGVRCVLIRDMTDAMYDSNMKPHVSHAEANELVIQYVEKYWAPTVSSSQVLDALMGISADSGINHSSQSVR